MCQNWRVEFFVSFTDATFVFFLVPIYHSKNRIKIVVLPVLWFKPLCLMSHVLVFLTIHGLGAPVGWILASGVLLYRLRLDQIVRFPKILELDEVWGTPRGTSSCITSVSDVRENQRRSRNNPPQISSTYMGAYTHAHIFLHICIYSHVHMHTYTREPAPE